MSAPSGWTRERWASAQINDTCNSLDAELSSIVRDRDLTPFQKSVLFYAALQAATEKLVTYDWWRTA